jgi:RimJ/RimL family protein N-acetyltransferase
VRKVIVGEDSRVGAWILERTGGQWKGDGVTIGLEEDGKLIAGVLYEDFNGANINIAVAGEGKRWLNREFLWFVFYYPFIQLKVRRVTALIASTNQASINFCQHIGFVREATLESAHPSGDLFVYKMFREDCKWLKIKRS